MRRDGDRALLLMAHGTKDPEGRRELRELEAMVQAAAAWPVALGVLEYPGELTPSLHAAADRLAALRPARVVAAPVLLLQAGHGKLDMPRELSAIRARHPAIRWTLAQPLLPHVLLRDAARERLHEVSHPTVGDHAGTRARIDDPDAILLVGRGSHDPHANSDLFKIARLFTEEGGHEIVEACFISQAPPGVPGGIDRCARLGARSVVVLPYFLHTGVLVRRIAQQASDAQARHPGVRIRVAPHLGNHINLVRLLLLRAREAFLGLRPPACLAGRDPDAPFLRLSGPRAGQETRHAHGAHGYDHEHRGAGCPTFGGGHVAADQRAPMAAAPMQYRPEGSPDWGSMWQTCCAPALDGSSPHRDTMLVPPKDAAPEHPDYRFALTKIARGIQAVSGMTAEHRAPGWIAVRCPSAEMAAWLSVAIVRERVCAIADGTVLLLPVGPWPDVTKEIEDVVTAVAKATHCWHANASGAHHDV